MLGIGAVMMIAGSILLKFGEKQADAGLQLAVGVGLVVPAFALIIIGGTFFAQAGAKAKRLLVDKLAVLLNISFEEKPSHSLIPRFRNLSLLPSYDHGVVEDQITGDVKGISFVIQEAHIWDRSSHSSSGFGIAASMAVSAMTRHRAETKFHGLLGAIDFHKSFHGTTIVGSDKGLMNRIASMLVEGERVRLESPGFEKRFEVYSNDQVEARYLLTPALMERILALSDHYGGHVQFAFEKGKLLFALDRRDDWMEVRSGNLGVADERYVLDLIWDLTFAYGLVDALKLDARTKA